MGSMTLRGQRIIRRGSFLATSSLDEVIDPIFQGQGAPDPSVAFLLEGSVFHVYFGFINVKQC